MSGGPEIPAEGTVLAGKYRVEAVLASGGMGVVVAAYDTQLHRKVALKFLLPGALGNAEAIARFMAEGRAAVQLKSEHVAKIIDVGTLENGSPYLVMEFLEGKDLGDVFGEARDSGRELPTDLVVDYILQAIDAIAEAHALGIVHRDLKPPNLFLAAGAGGTEAIVKVLDFGISKRMEGMDGSLTQTNAVMGSPLYMSPEQFRSAKKVDARSDIWSLGVILYEGLTGAVPFGGESFGEVCARVLEGTPDPMSAFRANLPAGLEEATLKCLRKKTDERYANVAELARALAQYGSGEAQRSVDRASRLLGMHVSSSRNVGRIPDSAVRSPPQSDSSIRILPPSASADMLGVANTITARNASVPAPALRSKPPVAAVGIAALAVVVIGGSIFAFRSHPGPSGATSDPTHPSASSEPSASVVAASSLHVAPLEPSASAVPSAVVSSEPSVEKPVASSSHPAGHVHSAPHASGKPPASSLATGPTPPPTASGPKPDLLDSR